MVVLVTLKRVLKRGDWKSSNSINRGFNGKIIELNGGLVQKMMLT